MTKKEKDLIWLLMQPGHYMVRAINAKGNEVFKILEGRQVPVQYFTRANVSRVKDILKTDHKKRMTLNLSAVRGLHGKSYIKVLYKKSLANLPNKRVE